MKWKIFSETFTKATESTLRLTRTGPKFGRKNCKTLFLLNQTPGYNNDFIANRKCCKTDGLCIHGLKSAFTLTNRQAVIVGTLLSGTNGINRKHVLITLHKIERNQLRTRKRHLAVTNHWHIHHSWKICRKASGNKTFYKTVAIGAFIRQLFWSWRSSNDFPCSIVQGQWTVSDWNNRLVRVLCQ